MSTVKLYHSPISAPSRGVLLAVRSMGLQIEVKTVDLFDEENLKESFLNLYPGHTIPTLDDDGFVLGESRAIASYLADKYENDDKWYPKDIKRRALVNQRLYFDKSLYDQLRAICVPIMFHGAMAIDPKLSNELNMSLEDLEQYLNYSKWVAGDSPSIADTSIYSSVTNILATEWDISDFPNIQRWIQDCSSLPGASENDEGATVFGEAFKNSLSKKILLYMFFNLVQAIKACI